MNNIKERILVELEQAEKEYNVNILYACESGSRAWGFPSPDSDYDVRFIYAHPEDWYLSVFSKRDVIEKPITDELDLGGWDIKKSLGLMATSNAPLLEWLHSPIVYSKDEQVLTPLRSLSESCFRARHVCYHYYVMAEKLWKKVKGKKDIKLKTLFYVLRALLCCEWIINEKSRPPVEMNKMLDRYYAGSDFIHAVTGLIELKSGLNEMDLVRYDDYQKCFITIEFRLNELFAMMPEAFPEEKIIDNKSVIDDTLVRIIRSK